MNEDTDAVVNVLLNDEYYYNAIIRVLEKSRKIGGVNRLARCIYQLKLGNAWLKEQAGGWPDMRKVSSKEIAKYFWTYDEKDLG